MNNKFRLTLRQVFALSLLGLIASLGVLFYLLSEGSERTVLKSSELLRNLASADVSDRVLKYLTEAPKAVDTFEQQLQYNLVDPNSPDSIQAGLLSLLLGNAKLSEVTFVYTAHSGHAPDQTLIILPNQAGQVTVSRDATGKETRATRVWFDGRQYVAQTSNLTNPKQPPSAPEPCSDPTSHLTFQTPARKDLEGQPLWTDLHWSQLDDALPENKRRVEVSVQKALQYQGKFAGVLRVGLLKEQIASAVQLPAEEDGNTPYAVFLCDNRGRLITSGALNERFAESGDDLRMTGDSLPPQVATALKEPILEQIDSENPLAATTFQLGTETYLCTFRALPETQDWIVGIVVPRSYYLGPLQKIRTQILWTTLGLIAAIVVVGALILRSVSRAQLMIVRETSRMNAFEFTPSSNTSRLGDVELVLTSLEKAKTAMRAMSKYVPVDLVRKLYHEGKEPVLGGESAELSVLFTDIKDFTPFAERTPPDQLAQMLGRYLEIMATVIQIESGTIDKYIGDAVMAFWNAPETIACHASMACGAALKCQAALRELYASPEWKGCPQFETRFGLHRCTVSVGHFGAPNRFNYTVIGDGVNFTSRLEGLNKHYGTTAIVSESIYSAAKNNFVFRLLDCVAVKGKQEGITIYELIAERHATMEVTPVLRRYEEGFELYRKGDFKAALALLEDEANDKPSQTLAARCRRFLQDPPETWTGVYAYDSK